MPAQPKVTKRALAPPLGTSLRLGVPSLRLWSVGRRSKACVRPAWFNGAPQIKINSRSKARARRPSSRPEWLKQKQGKSTATHSLSDVPSSKCGSEFGSQLPQLIEFSLQDQVGCQAASALLLICFNHSGRLLGRRAVDFDLDLLLILILGVPLSHAGRTQVLRSG